MKQAKLIFIPVKTLRESKNFGKFKGNNYFSRWSGIGGTLGNLPFQPMKAILIEQYNRELNVGELCIPQDTPWLEEKPIKYSNELGTMFNGEMKQFLYRVVSDNLKPREVERIIENNYHCQYELISDKLKIFLKK